MDRGFSLLRILVRGSSSLSLLVENGAKISRISDHILDLSIDKNLDNPGIEFIARKLRPYCFV